MARALTPILVLLPLLACQAKSPLPTRESTASDSPPPPANTQRMAAAGYQLLLPETWTIATTDNPEFAYAQGPGSDPPICTIEVRRQDGNKPANKPEDYRRGRMRGRLQRLPGPSKDAAVIVHCASPRGLEWAPIEAAFESLREDPGHQHTNTPANDGPIVELCTGTPVRQTYVCARSRSGEVHCGISEADTLEQVPDIGAAQQIACDGIRACSRAADGTVSCWSADIPPVSRPEFQGARDLAGGCIVDAQGKLSCRAHPHGAQTTDEFVELLPLDDPGLALGDVDQVLAGSNPSWGCVLSSGTLRCWDRGDELGLALPDHAHVHALPTPASPRDLARLGKRVCVAGPEQWTCIAGDRQLVLDACDQHSCGCSLTGAMAFSCEDEPFDRPDARWFGHVDDVVLSDGACAALRDGTVLCRGIATGHADDAPRIRELVVGGRPGIVHELRLSSAAPPTD